MTPERTSTPGVVRWTPSRATCSCRAATIRRWRWPWRASSSAWYQISVAERTLVKISVERARQLDPFSLIANANLARSLYWGHRYDEAIGSYRAVLRLSPGRGGAHAQLGMVLLQKGDAPAALAEIEQEKNETWRMLALPMARGATASVSRTRRALTGSLATGLPNA